MILSIWDLDMNLEKKSIKVNKNTTGLHDEFIS